MALLTKQNNTMKLQTCVDMLPMVTLTAGTYRYTHQIHHMYTAQHLYSMWVQICCICALLEGTEFGVMQSCPFFGGAIVIVTKDVSEARRLLQ